MFRLTSRLAEGAFGRPEEVALIQKSLTFVRDRRQHPFYQGAIDGRFGRATRTAVASFQESRHLFGERAGEVTPDGATVRQLAQDLRLSAGVAPETLLTGLEAATSYREPRADLNGGLFEVRPSNVPGHAVPVVDEEIGAVIGFRSIDQGVTKVYDLRGDLVEIREIGLEKPLLDPIDLVSIGGVLAVSVRKAILALSGAVAGRSAGSSATSLLTEAALSALRRGFRSLNDRPLKFTAATSAHMKNPDRYVPVHILRLAIRYGRRRPDPQGVKGAYMYHATVTRNGKTYSLEVLLRESDSTVLHFLIER